MNQPANQFRTSRRTLIGATTALAAGSIARLHTGFAQDAAPVRGGSLTMAVVGPITSLDPFSSKLGSGDGISYLAIYNTLVGITRSGEIVPELAREWTISDDGLTYTFTLNEGVTFHDGTSLDAAAVVANFDRYMAEGSTFPGTNKLAPISSIEATDATTVTITLSAPNAPFLAAMSNVQIASPTAVESLGEDFALNPVGSGPFKLESWEPGSTATYVRNENYWQQGDDGQPLPYLDKFIIEGVPDDSVRLLNLRSGTFDINERVEPRDRAQLEADSSLQLIDYASVTTYQLALNVTAAPFDNQPLRQAVAAAIDRDAIIQNISFGTGYTIALPFPRDAWFSIEGPTAEYNLDTVAAKLEEAGYPDGADIKLSIINRPIDNQIAQIVKAQLDAANIRTEIEVLERTTWVDLWNARGGQLGILQRGSSSNDPDDQSAWFDTENIANFAGYDSQPIRDLIAQANETTDQEERKAYWQQIAEIVVEDAVYIFIGAVPVVGAMKAGVQGVSLSGGATVDIEAAWIQE